MYLHENRDLFQTTIAEVEKSAGIDGEIIEKDYYVTLILHELVQKQPECVFKGGTSLSKGFHVINRFSEDIDITFSEHIGKERRKHLKYETVKSISETLHLPITNWDETESNRDLNTYLFAYDSVCNSIENITHAVKLETSLGSSAFPTTEKPIGSYIGDYLRKAGCPDIAFSYHLDEFTMTLQSLERTYIDKIFAIADYYMQNRYERCSRHLYDIKKLAPIVFKNDDGSNFAEIFRNIREERQRMNIHQKTHEKTALICPSAEQNVNLPDILLQICNTDFYKSDYKTLTPYFLNDTISYAETIDQIKIIADELYKLPEYAQRSPKDRTK